MLASVAHEPPARRIVSDVLPPLLDYDARTARDLLRALEVFLEDGCNTISAARRLCLNRHSPLYGLGKIESLTGRSLGSANDRFMLDLKPELYQFGLALEGQTA